MLDFVLGVLSHVVMAAVFGVGVALLYKSLSWRF